jgi:hypothetical protein
MGPSGPLRKDDGPACRVCGCTEHNACLIDVPNQIARAMQTATPKSSAIGCSWVEVEKGSPPLCSACAGTADDMREAIVRGMKWLQSSTSVRAAETALHIGQAALDRRDARAAAENPRGR